MRKIRHLAAKSLLLVAVSAHATGIPVVDALGLVQTTLTAAQSVEQTLQLAQAYQTQLEQFNDQRINSLGSAMYLWDQADQTIGNILSVVDAVSPLLSGGQSEDEYLGEYKSLEDYDSVQQESCYTNAGCVAAHSEEIAKAQGDRSTQQAVTNQAAMRGVIAQQQAIQQDARNLRQLQSIAQTSQGRMAAIQAGNQLLSAQVNNLLQMRTILTSQQQVQVAQAQAQATQQASLNARNKQMLRGTDSSRAVTDGAKF